MGQFLIVEEGTHMNPRGVSHPDAIQLSDEHPIPESPANAYEILVGKPREGEGGLFRKEIGLFLSDPPLVLQTISFRF
jgi:hypothetical protein